MDFKLLCGGAIEQLHTLPDRSINTCVTSPPYYGLRDYETGTWVGGDPNCPHYRISKRSDITSTGHAAMVDSGHPVGDAIYKTMCPLCGAVREDQQIGLEETPEEYIERLVKVFREVKRVLRDDGVLWVNIGDSYNASGHGRKADGTISFSEKSSKQATNVGSGIGLFKKTLVDGCKPKDLIGIPWMLAFALRADGWYLRSDVIWAKKNPMPESVKDRCTRSHEYIFMLTKNKKYWFDHGAIQEPTVTLKSNSYTMRNKRDVWTVGVCSTVKEAHFAVFPKELIEPCILSSCPNDGWVLDPFSGSGTTGIVALNNNRNYIGIDLNPEYNEIAERRIQKECTNVSIVERNP